MSNLINMNGGFYCDSEYKNINHALDFSGFNLGQAGGGDEYKNKFIASGLYVKHINLVVPVPKMKKNN